MKNTLLMNFSIDKENNTVKVEREFAAPLQKVWAAWTESEILDQWWAPKPYKAKTKSMDFREGGRWLYAMVAPDGVEHWCRADYQSIDQLKSYSLKDAFCDENGTINNEFPRSFWTNTFNDKPESTLVIIEIKHEKLSDLEKILEMGFKEGFTAGLENLDEYLKA
ncbi:SRPBCC domain-containing protein [Pedobacter sp. HMF7647]|uniref:SRPBCC domain-containing protein n=1 Tax=Hufsiella arboris TaxID=2695275 RepID=A0A7K1YD54_9SPHI|nr:SRPBCC domain-containing protein [Hufsiella arboris]MXV52350.1 SRPBCC domain-containing protein [Hufsiella arboris]